MRSLVALITLAVPLVLAPVVVGQAPAMSQDFSITNQVDPIDVGRRDLLNQLQAWWNNHAYYPKHASNNDDAGTVKIHLVIHTDGTIWMANVVESSGSPSLDVAATAAFRGGFVRRFPTGIPEAVLDVSAHYVLAYRRDQQPTASITPVSSGRSFTITNQPVQSPILETMLQKSCTGTVVKQGIRNHPSYGVRYQAQAIFFRRPDGTPWVRFSEGGSSLSLAPIVQVGKVLRWSGPEEHHPQGGSSFTQYTAWADGDNVIIGDLETVFIGFTRAMMPLNRGGTIDFTCANQVIPAVTWSAFAVTPGQDPPGDPP